MRGSIGVGVRRSAATCIAVAIFSTASGSQAQTSDPRRQQLGDCIAKGIDALTAAKHVSTSSPNMGLYIDCPSPQGVLFCISEQNRWIGYRIPQVGATYQLDTASVTWHEDESIHGSFQGLRLANGNSVIQVHLYCKQTKCFGEGYSIGGHVDYSMNYIPTIDDKRRIAGECLSQ